MKITEYSAVSTLNENNVFLTDGTADGTRKISAKNAAKSLNNLLTPTEFVKPLEKIVDKTDGLDIVSAPAKTNSMLIYDGDGVKSIDLLALAKALNGMLTSQQVVDPLNMTEIQSVDTFSAGDKILIGLNSDGSTRAINVDDILYTLLDEFVSVEQRRNIFRGKNLGTSLTAAQRANIANGTFKGFFIGDYWVINNVTYRIADMDYWWNSGDTACTTHHLVIVPDKALYNGQMNGTNTTSGGYVGSTMYKTGLDSAKNTINAAFGANYILNHRELLTNAISGEHASGGSWYDSTVELPNEIMWYGTQVFTNVANGTAVPYSYTIDKEQLALMRLCHRFCNPYRENQWLRDVVSSTYFARANGSGIAVYNGASYSIGVRPVFGIHG